MCWFLPRMKTKQLITCPETQLTWSPMDSISCLHCWTATLILTLLSPLELSNFFLVGVFSSSFFLFSLCLAVKPAVGTAANNKCVCTFSAILVCKWWGPAVLWIVGVGVSWHLTIQFRGQQFNSKTILSAFWCNNSFVYISMHDLK